MGCGMGLRDWVPPAVMTAVRRYQQWYPTYDAALAACGSEDYEDGRIVDVVVEKTRRFRDRIASEGLEPELNFSSACSLTMLYSAGPSRRLNVVDFGGAAGAHYFTIRALLPSEYQLRWVVVETPAMAAGGAKHLANDELSFTAKLQEAEAKLGHIDLLHSSGTLQCLPDPIEQLRSMMLLPADHILLGRLALTTGDRPLYGIHGSCLSEHGPGVMPEGFANDFRFRIPIVYAPETRLRSVMAEHYRVASRFEDSSGISHADPSVVGYGLLLKSLAATSGQRESSHAGRQTVLAG